MRLACRIVLIAAALAAFDLHSAGQSSSSQTLAVEGAANSTPSLAASESAVAAVWTATKDGVANVYLAVSSDGGATFSPPRRVNDNDGDAGATNEQPPRVVISGSGAARTITVLWSKRDTGPQDSRRDTMRLARSTDGGRTFSPARFAHDPSLSGARGWQALALGRNGTLHAVWLDGREAQKKTAELAHKGTPHKGQPPQEMYHGRLSADGQIVETRIATDVCFCCKTTVAVDANGAIYTAWRHIFPGSMRDIAFAKSVDGGRQFSALVRVSEDNWQLNGCPEDGPSLAVDKSGTIHIAWSTLINEEEPYKAIFYAQSRDGKVFSARARVPTSRAVTPGHPQLALSAAGEVAIVFDEVAGGARRVSLARVSANGVVQPPERISGDESASNPVIVSTAGNKFLVAWTSRPSGPAGLTTIRFARVD